MKTKQRISEEDMTLLLTELAGTDHYRALLQLFEDKQIQLMYGINAIDPYKDPTMIARYQGEIGGYEYISMFITKTVERVEKAKLEEN